jgi:asparagine synthase (glutamine-hydrolysing)
MCGILGTVNQPFDPDVLDLLRHRGPDGSGVLSTDTGTHRITLGHTRLAIVDLSPTGHQPMDTRCGRSALVFNGEVYNHSELRQLLGGIDFRGSSDSETVLEWLTARGVPGLAEMNGIFGLAWVDVPAGRLYLARDPFGVKPLYYYADSRRCVFASEIKPIRRLVEDEIDLSNVAEVLRFRSSPSPDPLFSNIRKVRPGHVIEVDLSGAELAVRERSYIPEPPKTAAIPFRDALHTYGALFKRSVERQLMSDVEVGLLLSGGIDSALVGTFAQRHSQYRMKAFTVGYAEADDSDEVCDASETAAALGVEHHVTRISGDDFLSGVRNLVSIIEEPLATTSIVPMFYLSRLAAQHVKVVLSGQGADETGGGYRRYQAEVLHDFVPPFVTRLLGRLPHEIRTKNEALRRGLKSFGIANEVDRFLDVYSVFSSSEIQGLIGRPDERSATRISYFFDLLRCRERSHSVEKMMALDLRMNLADDLLLYTDKVTMHHSLECRVPLLDLELVRFIESMPADYRVRMRRGKYIHKQFGRTVLPSAIVNRRKKGFLSPAGAWFRRKNSVRDILLDRTSRFAGYFDLQAVERLLRDHEAGHNRERHIFLLLNLNYWMAEFA